MKILACAQGAALTQTDAFLRELVLLAQCESGGNLHLLLCGERREAAAPHPGISVFHYAATPDALLEKSMGAMPLLAWQCQRAVRQYIDENGRPDVILFSVRDALAYYVLQGKWMLEDHLQSLPLVLFCAEEDLPGEEAVGYQFPAYWNYRMQVACLLCADAVLCTGPQVQRQVAAACGAGACTLYVYGGGRADALKGIVKEIAARPARTRFPFSNQSPLEKPATAPKGEAGLLSVVIPFYNLGATLAQTLDSVEQIDYPHYEVILVNDGSSEADSVAQLRRQQEKRPWLRVIDIENGGLANARNVGAEAAAGEFLTFLDADDKIDPGYYSRGVAILQRYENVGYVYPWVAYFEGAEGYWVTYNTELPYLLLGNMPSGGGTIVRRSLFLSFGKNRPVMKGGMEDYDGWLGMVENGHFGVCLPQPLYLYRIRSGSMFRSIGAPLRLELYRLLQAGHAALYKAYSAQIFNLMAANGSPLHWVNPSAAHSTLGHRSEEALAEMEQAAEQLRQIHQSPSLFWRVVRRIWAWRAR